MPNIPCDCGGVTNTAVSEHLMLFGDDNKATECYAKWVDGKVVHGCAYEKASPFMKRFVEKMILNEAYNTRT